MNPIMQAVFDTLTTAERESFLRTRREALADAKEQAKEKPEIVFSYNSVVFITNGNGVMPIPQ
jgi:hypothetical protein